MSLKDQDGNTLLPASATQEKFQYHEVWFVCEHWDGYNHSAHRLDGPMDLHSARTKCDEKNSELRSSSGYRLVPLRLQESRPRPRGEQKPGRQRTR